jgi:hypothetical protein
MATLLQTFLKNAKINPEWTAYNNLHNEGGEGYNPHPKHLSATCNDASLGIIHEYNGRTKTKSQWLDDAKTNVRIWNKMTEKQREEISVKYEEFKKFIQTL